MNAPIPPEVESLVLAELAKRVKARTAAAKAVIGGNYAPGRRETFRSPVDDTKLGLVYRSDPDPEWRVTDRQALGEWLTDRDEYTETAVEIRTGCEPEAMAVLNEHAPHLLDDVVRIREGAVQEVLAESKRLGEAAAPGIEKVKPEGVLTVRPDKAAGDAISRMVEAGILTWDGRPALEQQDGAA